jgi:hydroxymethylpyrimidine/phosphomethylpyrimidine kinase
MEPVAAALVVETLDELAADMEIGVVKIGMLGTAKIVKAVVDFLERQRVPHVVLDPVLKSSSGTELLEAAGEKLMRERLLALATVTTPNLDEAARLVGGQVRNPEEMKTAAAKLHGMGAKNVVITGGHLDKAIDLLSFTNGRDRSQHTGQGVRSRLQWRATWRWAEVCRKRCCWRRPTLGRRYRMRSHWGAEPVRCIIFIA